MGEQWNELAKHFKSIFELITDRNARQIKQHYNNYLRPGVMDCDWTLENDLKLVELLNLYGKSWK